MGHTRDYILFLLSLLEHGKEVTCILTYVFAQASTKKEQIVFPLESDLISSDLERKKGNLELKMTFWVAESRSSASAVSQVPNLFHKQIVLFRNMLFPPCHLSFPQSFLLY